MKVLDIPSSGKRGIIVAYQGRYGLCHRAIVVPANTQTPARQHMRRAFAKFARAWGGLLTQAQRDLWDDAGPKVQSASRLDSGPLTGQQLFQGLNSARACIGQPPLWDPPAPVSFGPNPVAQLLISYDQTGLRLQLQVTAPVTEAIMVFGQAPCSAGRRKRRNVSYLGLLSAVRDGLCDITAMYVARYGAPRPGERVFIVTRQQKNGWEGYDQQTSEIVPPAPQAQQAIPTAASTLSPHMHKGCTRDAQGIAPLPSPEIRERIRGDCPVEKAAAAPLDGDEEDQVDSGPPD